MVQMYPDNPKANQKFKYFLLMAYSHLPTGVKDIHPDLSKKWPINRANSLDGLISQHIIEQKISFMVY